MVMILHITQVNYLSDYKLSVSFNNGESGVADLSSVVHNGVFKALASQEKFAQVGLDGELETIVWPGGLDLAPEFVYFHAFKDKPQHQRQFKAWGYVS
jgi:Protein of unknown function (DUF2442)